MQVEFNAMLMMDGKNKANQSEISRSFFLKALPRVSWRQWVLETEGQRQSTELMNPSLDTQR